MTYTYTTPQKVQEELRATTAFSSATYPSLQTVTGWIQEESDEINTLSGRKWGVTSYSETIDYAGEGIITLKNAPLVSVTNFLYTSSPLGTDTYSLSASMVDGEDYTAYFDEGEIALLSNKPYIGRKAAQINYTAGYETTPERIQKLATKKVTKRVVDSLISKDINEKQSGKSVSVGSISIVKPADFGVSQYKILKDEITELENKLTNGTTAYRIGGHRY